MNNKNSFISPLSMSIGVLLSAALTFAACKKNNNDSNPIAALSISHAAPGFPAYDFKINGVMVLRRTLKYGTYLDYDFLNSGKQEFSVSPKGSMEVSARSTFTLKPQTYYSIYIADSASKPAFLLTEDDLSAPPAGKAKIRFVNLGPDAGPLDLSVSGKDSLLFSKTDYRTSTEFKLIDTTAALKMQITETGNANVLSSTTIKIEKNRVYTLRATGLKTATDSTKLGLSLITNR